MLRYSLKYFVETTIFMPMPSSSATRRFVVFLAYSFSALERCDAGFLKAFPKTRWWFVHVASSPLHQPGASSTPNLLFIFLAQLCGTAVQPPSWLTFAPSRAESLS